MITWMKLLRSRLNQRLKLDDILADPDKYSCKWVMDKCKNEGWGDTKVWIDAFNGFVDGWNHLAARVTTDSDLEDVPVDTVKNNDETDEKKNNDNIDRDIRIARKNQLKKFIKITNVSEPLLIKPIIPKSTRRKKLIPIDVPMVYGMDTSINGKLDT
eukprot:474977_1